MKHLPKLFFAALLGILALASCVKEPFRTEVIEPGDGLVEIQIDGEIRQVATKASANGFDNGDALGLFAVNYLNGNTEAGELQPTGNQADNVQYVFDQANYKWVPVKPVYYKDINTDVDLYGYYPYQKNIDSVASYNFEVKQDQSSEKTTSELGGYEASDLLWGKTTHVSPTESKIKIKLGHIMAGIQVDLIEGTGFAEGEFDLMPKAVLVENTTRKAEVDFATGVVSPVGAAQSTGIVMAPQGDDGSFRAVVVPQSVSAGEKLFSISLGSVSYGFRQNATDVEYAAGKLTAFTIRLNKKQPSGEVELVLTDTQIIDWVEDRNTHGGEAKQYYVVNVPKPGQLGRTIKAAKKNPDKIKNLKVVGTVNDNDFYFMRDSMAILEAVNMKEAVLRCVDTDNYNGILSVAVEDFDDSYIQTYGEPNLLVYNEGVLWAYSWYPEEAIGANIPVGAFDMKKSLYSFVFPEIVEYIGSFAFNQSNIAGEIIIPEDVVQIGWCAFEECKMITGLQFGSKIKRIHTNAFRRCESLSCKLELPNSLRFIGQNAFSMCRLQGELHLPSELEFIDTYSFSGNYFSGNLFIPDKIKEIPKGCFSGNHFSGSLNLNNVQRLEEEAFYNCTFQGELVLPEGIQEIPERCFIFNNFSTVIFPSTLKSIGMHAFSYSYRLTDKIAFPEGLLIIGSSAFYECRTIQGLDLPSTLISLGDGSFSNCYSISSIVCKATQVPNVLSGAFDGISKDSFTLEVPESSVTRYQAATGWGDFRRISGHYDFSISRKIMRGLNAEISNTYTLRAPAGFDWSIESKPDWVTVTPDRGTGKEEVTVTFAEMPRNNDKFGIEKSDWPYYDEYKGRAGEVVFLLNDKDYRSTMVVEQYDSDYQDGQAMPIETASKGNGIDIIYIGDGYDARDIATGKFKTDVENGNTAFFGLEPYATYKDYFNVYAVVSMSKDSGIGTVNTVVDTKFGSYFTQNRILAPDASASFAWANKAKSGIDFSNTLVIMLQNASVYEGVTMMYGDGSAIACCPISTDAYPYDFRGIIQHEAGGHGFGKLGDEYIYHGAFIQTCDCVCCAHPENFDAEHARGWYRNLSMESDMKNVPWSHLIFHNKYSDYVDMYEGGYMHSRGVYRSEATSCMNNNIPYYSAISRQAIVERIMDYAGEEFDFNTFVAKDSRAFGATKAVAPFSSYMVEMLNDGREHTYPIYMGEHPEF